MPLAYLSLSFLLASGRLSEKPRGFRHEKAEMEELNKTELILQQKKKKNQLLRIKLAFYVLKNKMGKNPCLFFSILSLFLKIRQLLLFSRSERTSITPTGAAAGGGAKQTKHLL